MRTLRPSSLSRTLALASPAVALVVQRADAAFDTFIKFADIKGESLDKAHVEWSNALSFDFGIEAPFAIGPEGGETGKAVAKPLVIRKLIDKASPQLFLMSAKGTSLPTVTLELTKVTSSGAPVVFYKMVLTNVFVSSVKTEGETDSTSGTPTETIELNYDAISIVYTVVDAKGGTSVQPEVTWNFVTNQK